MTGPAWRVLLDRLTQEIASGERVPGSRLPSIAEQTAAGFGQTTTLRVYELLRDRGVAVSVQGKGWFVADPLPSLPAPGVGSLEERVARLEAEVAEIRDRLG